MQRFAQTVRASERVRGRDCPAPRWRRLLRLETEDGTSRETLAPIFMADDLLERAARRPAATASCLHLHALPHRHPLRHRSGSARGRHGLGRAVTCHSPAPCCFQSIHSGLQQVRVLRKLMPGKGFYMDVLCYLLKAWKRCAVPAAIASCCHGCSCALLASRLSLIRYGAVLSSCISCRCLHFASQSSGAQGRLKSRKIESGL